MQPNTPAFLPTGEVRPMRAGEYYFLDGDLLLRARYDHDQGDQRIYRAVPADSVVERRELDAKDAEIKRLRQTLAALRAAAVARSHMHDPAFNCLWSSEVIKAVDAALTKEPSE